MAFSSWEKGIKIERYAINDTYASGSLETPFSKYLVAGTYFISFSPMLTGEDVILRVSCKIGSKLDTADEKLVAFLKSEPTDYANMEYEQFCMSGIYISEGDDLEIKVEASIDNSDDWNLETMNATSSNISIIKLS